jgi:HD-like signal output (HDOD) protein
MEPKECKNCNKVFASESDYLENTSRWRKCSEGNLWFNCSCGSTLFLKKGKYDWFSPDMRMSESTASLFNRLSHKDSLPYIKNSVLQLQELLTNPNVDMKDIEVKLKKEPIIAGEVLSLATKLKAARSQEDQPMDSLYHAMLYIGASSLSDIVLMASLKMVEVKTKHFDVDEFWESSFVTALITEYMCENHTSYHNKDEMYLGGFLLNIGKIVAAIFEPELVDKIYLELKDPKNKSTWVQLEEKHGAISHKLLGEMACAIWGFSDKIIECCLEHHSISKNRAKYVTANDLVAFANQMTHWIVLQPDQICQPLLDELAKKFGFETKQLDDLGANLGEFVRRVG